VRHVVTERVRLELLVLDYNLYPRNAINSERVSQYADAMRAGSMFPPIRIERGTNRIVDGFKRYTASRRLGLEDINAEVYEFDDEAEVFYYALAWNAAHGEPLDTFDISRCILIGEKLGLTRERIAEAAHITIDKLERIYRRRIRFAKIAMVGDGGTHEVHVPVAVKRVVSEAIPEGAVVPHPVLEKQEKFGGMRCGYYLAIVVDFLEEDLVREYHWPLVERLRDASESWLRRHRKNTSPEAV